ncbi:MAG TPA: hypothetical protein PK514_16000 [Spirochaetota bacterium]|nr:hypothetical protein [Spirochaetota bacterium]
MKKTMTLLVLSIFFSSMYALPSLSAITLGEIKSDKETDIINKGKVADDSVLKKDDKNKKTVKPEKDNKKGTAEEKSGEGGTKKVKEINPRLVCLLSVVMPGGGHFYLGNDTKGIAFCFAAGAGYTAAGFFFIKTMLADVGSVEHRNYLLLTGFVFFITLIVHFVGIIEAYSDAEEINKKNLFNGSDDPFETEVIM